MCSCRCICGYTRYASLPEKTCTILHGYPTVVSVLITSSCRLCKNLRSSLYHCQASIAVLQVDPAEWRLEVERVAPRLKITVASDARDWRSHLDEAHRHSQEISTVWPGARAALGAVQTEVVTMDVHGCASCLAPVKPVHPKQMIYGAGLAAVQGILILLALNSALVPGGCQHVHKSSLLCLKPRSSNDNTSDQHQSVTVPHAKSVQQRHLTSLPCRLCLRWRSFLLGSGF